MTPPENQQTVEALAEKVRNRPAKMPYAPFDPNSPVYYIEEPELSDLAARARENEAPSKSGTAGNVNKAVSDILAGINGFVPHPNDKIMRDALADLDAIARDVEKVREGREMDRRILTGFREAAEADRDRLARRVAELKAALREIAGDGNSYAPCLPGCVEGPPTCGCAEERARAALAGDGGGA